MLARIIILFIFLVLLFFEISYAAFPISEYNKNILATNDVHYNIPEGIRIVLILLLSGGGFLLGFNFFSSNNNSKLTLIFLNLLLILVLVFS